MTKALEKLVDDFAREMKAKLDLKHRNGWAGWDNMNEEDIQYRLGEHTVRILCGGNEEVDVANFCAFLWYAKRKRSRENAKEGRGE